jgi:hypothetical protein
MSPDSFDLYVNGVIKKCDELDRKIDQIMFNHLHHIQQEITEINVKISETKTDVEWLKRSYWILVAPVVGALAVGILNLIIK